MEKSWRLDRVHLPLIEGLAITYSRWPTNSEDYFCFFFKFGASNPVRKFNGQYGCHGQVSASRRKMYGL